MTPARDRGSRPPPAWLIALAAVGFVFLVLPLIALISRTPWHALPAALTGGVAAEALRLSLIASIAATTISAFVGIPLAFLLARVRFPGRSIARGVVLMPLVLPPVVGGAALLFAFGRRGLLGEPLYEATGLVLPFSIWGVIAAVTFVSMPFVVMTVEGALRNLDTRYEDAASTLGADRWAVLRRVTLPMIRPAIVAGLTLTWARALGEFGATIVFAGNLPGSTRTLPLAVFVALESDRDTAITLSLVLVLVALVVVVALRDRWWRTL